MTPEFDWPLPPHTETIPKIRKIGGEPESCQITLVDGRRRNGKLLSFDPENMRMLFMPDQSVTTVSLHFEEINQIVLTSVIELREVALQGISPENIYPANSKFKCAVSFHQGSVLMTDTIGHVETEYGLFLFTVSYARNVLRMFLPSQAIKSYQIGDHLGKMLVERKALSVNALHVGLDRQQVLREPRLGSYLKNSLTQSQIEAALKRQQSMPILRLGEALIQDGAITQEQLDGALATQTGDRKKQLGEILLEMGLVDSETIKRVLAQKLGIPFVDLRTYEFNQSLLDLVPAEMARRHTVIPLYQSGNGLRLALAMVNPLATDPIKEIGFKTRLTIDPVMASEEDIKTAIELYYTPGGRKANIAEMVTALGDGQATVSEQEIPSESDNALVRLVNKIILDAHDKGASDIHIESMKGMVASSVRFRVDGVLHDYSEVPANFRAPLISRLKIMARLDISERRMPQDGKINFEPVGHAAIELRIVTIPTVDGLEDVVLRILNTPRIISMDSLGFAPDVLEKVTALSQRPHGLVLVCGPTGSGKTTTLHAVLGSINTRDKKIWTIENPIEITQKGLRQIQVNHRIDATFVSILRSILRADPDVIMVGETRDPETAKTLLEASLSGHVVFSTMHTNSAVESVVRLLDLGLDPFTFADALLGVVGQRLVRKLCPDCREAHLMTRQEINLLAEEYCFETQVQPKDVLLRWLDDYGQPDGNFVIFKPVGCPKCGNKGYKGRLGVHELLVNNAGIREMIHGHKTVKEIETAAIAQGMRTLRQDGIEKILQGHTDWEQVKAI